MSDLISIDIVEPVKLFTSQEQLERIVNKIKEEVSGFIPDVESDKGRKEIASMARKVSSSKVAIDKIGKELVADWKGKAKLVDNGRKFFRESLDNIRDDVRKPLTDWENDKKEKEAEEQRQKEEQEHLDRERIESELKAKEEELRKKKEEIAAKERAIKEAEEKELLKKEAEETAKKNSELEIQRERERAEREIQAIKDESARKERERLKIEEDKKRAEDARKADIEHRRIINRQAVQSIVSSVGCDEETAQDLVRAIASNKIENVIIKY